MDLAERILFFVLGSMFGYMLAIIVGRLRVIEVKLDTVKLEVHEVDELVKKSTARDEVIDEIKGEGGWFDTDRLKDFALLFVLALTVWAAFSSQKAANDSENTQGQLIETQDQIVALALCNQEFLSKTISALNQRTEYSTAQATANVKLQKSQATFYTLLLGKNPPSDTMAKNAAEVYLNDLTNFVKVSEKQASAIKANDYPTNEELAKCLEKKMQPKESK